MRMKKKTLSLFSSFQVARHHAQLIPCYLSLNKWRRRRRRRCSPTTTLEPQHTHRENWESRRRSSFALILVVVVVVVCVPFVQTQKDFPVLLSSLWSSHHTSNLFCTTIKKNKKRGLHQKTKDRKKKRGFLQWQIWRDMGCWGFLHQSFSEEEKWAQLLTWVKDFLRVQDWPDRKMMACIGVGFERLLWKNSVWVLSFRFGRTLCVCFLEGCFVVVVYCVNPWRRRFGSSTNYGCWHVW